MPDKNRENFVVQQFLELYNSDRSTKYVVVARPEENPRMAGTFDFLCEDEEAVDNRLAIEEKSLNKSSVNVRDNKLVRELLTEVEVQTRAKGILGSRQYWFYLDFANAPKKKDKVRYSEKLADIVERTIRENSETRIRKPVSLVGEGLDCIRRLELMSARESSLGDLYFPFSVQSNESRDVSGDILNALVGVVVSTNSSLEVPKRKGVKTVLLVTDCLAFGDGEEFRRAMESIPPEIHPNIDEAFIINKNTFNESYSLCGIK